MREDLDQTIVIDLRCLQGPKPAEAVLAFLSAFTALAPPARLLGLTNGALPPPAGIAVTELRLNAYLPDLPTGSVFLNPAAHGPDDLFIAKLLLRDDIRKIAVSGGALATGVQAANKTLWLTHYDAVLPALDAAAVWAKIQDLPRHFTLAGRRPRIAMLTPLPPTRSGVADYSAALAKSLEKFADVSLFAPESAARVSILPHVAKRFDRVVSVLGNSGHHALIYDFHARYGSAVICHDSRLLHFFAGKFGLVRTSEMASRELGRNVDRDEIQLWLNDERQRAAICFGDLPQTARPLIVHARAVASRTGAAYLPFAIYRPWAAPALLPAQKRAARERLGFGGTEKIIISCGFINPSKGIDAALRAMEMYGGTARLVFVGQQDGPGGWKHGNNVTFLDRFIDEPTYRDFLRAADAALQLRAGGVGNISGALQDCIAAGLPTIANSDLAEALDAPGYVRRVSDDLDPAEIAAALEEILAAEYETEPQRLEYNEAHTMHHYARGLCESLGLQI
jgi:glycosyltransferase involved in cell wall biosynthesis